jgi:hypothetical protein
MALEYVYRALVAAQYTGAQGAADVAAAVGQITQMTGNTWSVQSDDGSVLVLRETSPVSGAWADWPILAGQVVVIDPSIGIVDRLAPSAFLARYRRADAVADATLTRGINTPAWITALKGKLGLNGA